MSDFSHIFSRYLHPFKACSQLNYFVKGINVYLYMVLLSIKKFQCETSFSLQRKRNLCLHLANNFSVFSMF